MTQNDINSLNPVVQFISTTSNSVFTTTTLIPRDNTIPQNTEGNQILTLTITPTSSTSKLLIIFECMAAVKTTAGNSPQLALFQDSNVNALTAVDNRTGTPSLNSGYLQYFMTSGTTSATTFNIRVGADGATPIVYINADATGARIMGGVAYVTMSITEFLA